MDFSVSQYLYALAVFGVILVGIFIYEHFFHKPKPQAVAVPTLSHVPSYSVPAVALDETLAQAAVRRGVTSDWPSLADFAGHMPRMTTNDQVINAYLARNAVSK